MATNMLESSPKPLSTAANLANLLPTGTVLTFQALAPSFSNNGSCLAVNKYLTFGVILVCSVVCFFSSFTDSYTDESRKLYYGIATTKGLYIFNKDEEDNDENNNNDNNKEKDVDNRDDMDKYKIGLKDFVHAFSSLMVFLAFATSSTDVQRCFFAHAGANVNTLMMNLPLQVGAMASLLFMIFPTKRRGIGFADSAAQICRKCNSRA